MRQKALALSVPSFVMEKWLVRRSDGHSRVVREALCYDAHRNRYTLVPEAVPPNLVYSMALGTETLLRAWPFFAGKLLDIGCGKKPYALFVDSLVTDYIGIDLPRESGDSRSDIFGDGQSLPFRSNSFDTILCTDVLEMVPAPMRLFQEANRVLKTGGHLILMISNNFDYNDLEPVLAHYTAQGLRLMAENSGFNVIVLRSKGKVLPYFYNLFIQVLYRMVQKLIGNRGAEKGWLENPRFWFNRLMKRFQLLLRKLTPKRSIDSTVEWIEGKDPRIISGHFHLGFLMVAKKVFEPGA